MATVRVDLQNRKRVVRFTGPGQDFTMNYNPRNEAGYVATVELEPGLWTITHTYEIQVEETENV